MPDFAHCFGQGAWTDPQLTTVHGVLTPFKRWVGSVRRELLDRILILNERHLRTIRQRQPAANLAEDRIDKTQRHEYPACPIPTPLRLRMREHHRRSQP